MANELIRILDRDSNQEKWSAPLYSSAGSGDAYRPVGTGPDGKLDESLMPDGVGSDARVTPSSEGLSAGDFVNYWWDSNVRKVRKADASNGRPAHGFVREAVSNGADATVLPLGAGITNSSLSGLTPGKIYYLDTTAGGVTNDISGFEDGDLVQELGIAVSATELQTVDRAPAVIDDP